MKQTTKSSVTTEYSFWNVVTAVKVLSTVFPAQALSRTWIILLNVVSHFWYTCVIYPQVCTKSLGSWFSWVWTTLVKQRSYTCWKMTDLANTCRPCIQVRRDSDSSVTSWVDMWLVYRKYSVLPTLKLKISKTCLAFCRCDFILFGQIVICDIWWYSGISVVMISNEAVFFMVVWKLYNGWCLCFCE